jgi:hypothetical protein
MELNDILFAVFYLAAMVIVVLHYTGWLEQRNLNWIVYVMAVAIFPVIFLL